jgi:hypothetical protein
MEGIDFKVPIFFFLGVARNYILSHSLGWLRSDRTLRSELKSRQLTTIHSEESLRTSA